MNNWIIVAIVIALVIVGFVGASAFITDEDSTSSDESLVVCNGGCSSGNTCGSETCAAARGTGSCNCRI